MDNNELRPPGHHHRDHEHFKTPDQIAAETSTDSVNMHDSSESHKAVKKGLSIKNLHKNLWRKFQKLSKKQKIIVAIVTVIVLVLIVVGLVLAFGGNNTPPPVKKSPPVKAVTKTSDLVPSKLTGVLVDPSVNQRPVTGVMIENSDAARPQSGLIDAGVVFEAIAEGGVTRFLALFQDTQPSNMGPIRSLRPYYLSWDMGFDAPIAHVGGSPDALADVGSWGAKDLDEFYNGSSYHRITSREAPHNVYTSMSDLNTLETSKGWSSSTFTGFPRKADAPAKTPTASSIDLTLSGYDYNAHYDYDASTNSYKRSEGGAAMTDLDTGAQIAPKVVIAIVVPLTSGALDATGAYYSDYSYLGTGPVAVFQDGTVTTGTWQKTSNASQITFSDASGNPIKLNAGQTWITAVGTSSDIAFKP